MLQSSRNGEWRVCSSFGKFAGDLIANLLKPRLDGRGYMRRGRCLALESHSFWRRRRRYVLLADASQQVLAWAKLRERRRLAVAFEKRVDCAVLSNRGDEEIRRIVWHIAKTFKDRPAAMIRSRRPHVALSRLRRVLTYRATLTASWRPTTIASALSAARRASTTIIAASLFPASFIGGGRATTMRIGWWVLRATLVLPLRDALSAFLTSAKIEMRA